MNNYSNNHDKVIFHIDVNSAFLSWESVFRLTNGKNISHDEDMDKLVEKITNENGDLVDLRTIPAAIGGDRMSRHGIVLAKSESAKKYGVQTGESIMEALKKCPSLLVVKSHHYVYRQYSKMFINILKEYTPDIEQFSVDEAFMDMTGTKLLFGDPIELAYKIKDRIKNELGFTVNVGISSNKLLAKMASDFEKPNKVHTLFPEEIKTKMHPLPVGDLFFVGKNTADKLKSLGINTIGELAEADKTYLTLQLKKAGEMIWNFANGIDFSIVQTEQIKNKGYGNSTTLSSDVSDAFYAKQILLSLSETVAARIRNDNVKVSSVCVTIKNHMFITSSHQKKLESPTNITMVIYENVCELFDEMWDGTPIRLLGVSTSKIDENDCGRQLTLFDEKDYEKLEKLDGAVDKIREKYGMGLVKRATLLERSDSVDKSGK